MDVPGKLVDSAVAQERSTSRELAAIVCSQLNELAERATGHPARQLERWWQEADRTLAAACIANFDGGSLLLVPERRVIGFDARRGTWAVDGDVRLGGEQSC